MAETRELEMTQQIVCHDEKNFESNNSLKVLDPDDPLMKRFQDALKIHLIKVNKRLTEDLDELINTSKKSEKDRLEKGNKMYEAQLEITNQEAQIEKWKKYLETIKVCHKDNKNNLKDIKESHYIMYQELNMDRHRVESMNHEIESLSSLCKRISEYESEISNHLTIAKRMSEKDASIQRDLIRQKQEMDYTMLRVAKTVWKLEKESANFQKLIDVKNNEKLIINQSVADADTDLGIIEREQKNLINTWNRVLFSIQQRDQVYDELSMQSINMRESLKNINVQMEKTKKDTIQEMENNEYLMTIHSKLNEEIFHNEDTIKVFNDKYKVVQYKTDSIIKLMEDSQAQYNYAIAEHQRMKNEENFLDRELEKLTTRKNNLEDNLMKKFEDKLSKNKTLKCLNKYLHDIQGIIKKFELTMLQSENQYSKCLLKINKLNNIVSNEKVELIEFDQIIRQKNNELNKLNDEIEKHNLLIDRKQKKIDELNKKIDEIKSHIDGNNIDIIEPHAIKVECYEKKIENIEIQNKENQRYWLRQEADIINLTDMRNSKLQEINRLSKQIIIIQQKNRKLENAIDQENKTEQRINRRIDELHHRLLKTNTILVGQKEVKNQLQDKNCIVKDEYIRELQYKERELINLQNNIKDLASEKCILEEKLSEEYRNNLSWDKKLKFAIETTKNIKQEQNPGGDVAIMRSEIRKMEIRLSYLKKVQEKMIKDMEHCVTRREMIVDTALTKHIKNPKITHNKRVMFEKRLNRYKQEIQQQKKLIKSVEIETSKLKNENEIFQCKIKENKMLLKNFQDDIIELDTHITDGNIVKYHKLECLVRKQRRIKLLQSIRDGKYKMICKSISTLSDEWSCQKSLNQNLIEIMEQTNQDFPLLKNDIRKILLTLQSN